MQFQKFRSLFVALLLIASVQVLPLHAQTDPFSRALIGGHAGVTYARLVGASNFAFRYADARIGHSSTFPFDDLGAGTGAVFGASMQVPLSRFWGLIMRISLVGLRTGSSETATRPNSDISGEAVSTVTTSYSNSWNFSSFDMLARYALGSSGLYSTAGLSGGLLASQSFSAHQTINSQGSYNFTTGSGPKTYDIPDFSSDNYFSSYQVALQLGLGYALPIAFLDNDILTPELSLSLPLTPAFTADGLQQNTASGMRSPNLFHVTLLVGLSIPVGREPTPPLTVATIELNNSPTQTPTSPPLSIAPSTTLVQGTVKDITGKAVVARVVATNLDNGTAVSALSTDSAGRYGLNLPRPGHFSITAMRDGLLFRTIPVTLDSTSEMRMLESIVLPPAKGQVPLLVFFGFNDAQLRTESYPELFRIIELLRSDASIAIELDGHTDNVGSDEYNQTLSEKRSDALKTFLVTHGVQASRIRTKGFGRSKPITDNTTEEGRTKNRRVEMVVR